MKGVGEGEPLLSRLDENKVFVSSLLMFDCSRGAFALMVREGDT